MFEYIIYLLYIICLLEKRQKVSLEKQTILEEPVHQLVGILSNCHIHTIL